MKKCSGCGAVKPLTAFSPDKRKKDGRYGRCRECRRQVGRKWREQNPEYLRAYYARNRSDLLAKQKARREADLETFQTKARERYHLNPEPQRARSKAAREAADPVQIAEYMRNWRVNNRERARALKRKSESKRRARKLGCSFEDIQPEVVFERDAGACGICNEPVDPKDWHLDHIIPLAAGGTHTYANVQVAHPICNLRKGARLAA